MSLTGAQTQSGEFPVHLTRPEGLLSLDSIYPVLRSDLVLSEPGTSLTGLRHLDRGVHSRSENHNMLLRQLSYAIKTQLKALKVPY